jgi:hypothetical protein
MLSIRRVEVRGVTAFCALMRSIALDDARDALDELDRFRQAARVLVLGRALDEVLQQRARDRELGQEVERVGRSACSSSSSRTRVVRTFA